MDDNIFTLQQFNFHSPSENEFAGVQFPLEGHYVYKDKEGALVVLALMFESGKSNSQLTNAWQQMPKKPGQSEILKHPVDIRALPPKNVGVYRFSCSLITPFCSEDVTWLVIEKPVSASAEQINQFRSILHHVNKRPIQQLNGRVIVD